MGQRPESVKELQCTSRVSAMAILLVTITTKIQCKPWACSCVLPLMAVVAGEELLFGARR